MERNKKDSKTNELSSHCVRLVTALNRTVEIFTSHSTKTFDELMSLGLGPIAEAVKLDRVAVYRLLDAKKMRVGQIYVWAGGKTVSLDEELVEIPECTATRRWLNTAMKGECINTNVMEMPRDEAEFLSRFGVKSILFVPIFIRDEFWGIVTLEDHTSHRRFENEVLPLLCSAARLSANAIIKNEIEREVADANDLNRATLDIIPVGFTIFDENFRLIDCNDAIIRILETDKDYFLNNFFEFSPKKQSNGRLSRDILNEVHRRAINGEQFVIDWIHCSKSGKLIPFEITLSRTAYKGGYVVLAYQYDLSSTNTMMENIRNQSRLLKIQLEQQELISDISRGFISSLDSDMYVKEAIAKLGRYLRASQLNIFMIDYIQNRINMAYNWSAEGRPFRRAGRDYYDYFKSKFPETLPEIHVLPLLSCKDVSMCDNADIQQLKMIDIYAYVCVPLYVEGKLWGVLSVEQLYSPRAWTENEKTFIAMSAGIIAGIIMRNLYNTKLRIAVDKANIASRAKSAFLSNMSHEIRTPLNAIIGMTKIGKTTPNLDRKDYALERIEDASSHLLGVINDILDMSKIEANKFELSPLEFSFEKMLQRVVNVVSLRAVEKKQSLRVRIDRSIPDGLYGDELRLSQVITNLVGNAVKFTPESGAIIIETKFLSEEAGVCSIEVKISDTGIGISPDQKKKLFKSFQQAELSTSRKFGGTGLGLAISKSIIEMMGGKISVESEIGKGSVFTFTVCMSRAAQKEKSFKRQIFNGENVNILVIDSDEETRIMVKDTINELGISCDTASSGEEALDLLDFNKTYDIYLVDWKLPGMNGIDFTSLIKKRECHPENISVVMFSTASWSSIEEEAKKAGVDKFITKPLFPSAVIDAVIACIGPSYEREKEKQPQTPDLKGCKLLLVEDIEINREIVLSLLENTNLEIDCAENGKEAVRMFSESPDKYNMIFMDLQMPEMDGLTAARSIRALNVPEAKTIPIIAMTANVFQEDIEKCLEAGMNNHLGKPLNLDEVMEKLQAYLPACA